MHESISPEKILPGSLFRGRYRIEAELGGDLGAMGRVWLVTDTQTGRRRALKVSRHPDSEQLRMRFRAECELSDTLGKIEGKGFVRALDYDIRDPTWMVMDLVENARPLGLDYDHTSPRPDLAGLLDAFLLALDRVEQLHAHGIIHRDIKPDNLLVDHEGQVYVLDFGIAKQSRQISSAVARTMTDARMGTPFYMPIEQFDSAETVDSSADVFALGAVLFHILTGAPPFYASSNEGIKKRQQREAPPRLSAQMQPMPEALAPIDALCPRLLSNKPEERPTIEEIRGAVRRARDLAASSGLGRPEEPGAGEIPRVPTEVPPSSGPTLVRARPGESTWAGVTTLAVEQTHADDHTKPVVAPEEPWSAARTMLAAAAVLALALTVAGLIAILVMAASPSGL